MIKLKTFTIIVFVAAAVTVRHFGNSSLKPTESLKGMKLKIAVDTSHCNYFIEKGLPKGYQIEILDKFAEFAEFSYEIIVVEEEFRLDMLKSKEADIAIFVSSDRLFESIASDENIRTSIPMDDYIKTVWMTNENKPVLSDAVNHWAAVLKGESAYNRLQTKYFANENKKKSDRISPYDDLFKKYAKTIDFDWRLLAAIAYNESMFRPEAKSPQGAAGLMQLMPATAGKFGAKNVFDPEDNVRAGVKLIEYLMKFCSKSGVPDDQIIPFVLASYNAGHGRMEQCRAFTKALGLDPNNWNDVVGVIPYMKNPREEHLPHLKSRFAGAKETMAFVSKTMTLYMHYRNLFCPDTYDVSVADN